ncbi:reverse transcriptase [Corchorus capsularis]|uniref:ADP-ribosylation factor-like protein 2 n=1 Tax=Corchorus capsularis TaxID=210143 RepID=A0A1R3KX34_COCAP|nr:reverse transcriptase [Corchorus capsularis]
MGLLSIIRKIKRKEKEMRILMVGLDNSGKTTIVLKINGEDTSVISPTLGFNIKTITYQKYTLNIWDVGGQRTIRSYWRNYFEQTDGLVWVVDSSDLRRLDDCKMELDNLLKEERLSGASLLILANKQDIKGALTPAEIAKVLNLEAMDKTRHWKIVGCSAYTGEGLLEGFDCSFQKKMRIRGLFSIRSGKLLNFSLLQTMNLAPFFRTGKHVENAHAWTYYSCFSTGDDFKMVPKKMMLAKDLACLVEESSHQDERKAKSRMELKRSLELRVKKRVKEQFLSGKFQNLMSKVIANPDTLQDAFDCIRLNSNVDISVKDDSICFKSLAEELLVGSFDVKANTFSVATRGKRKEVLVLPNLKLRTVQEAIRIVLEVVYRPHFSKISHGCRSGRGHSTALRYISKEIGAPSWWFTLILNKKVDVNILAKLISKLKDKVEDNQLYAIIQSMFDADVLNFEFGGFQKGHGLPQEGVLSPILMNIYLDLFDQEFYRLSMRYEALNTGVYKNEDMSHSKLRDWFRRHLKENDLKDRVNDDSSPRVHCCRFMDEVFFAISGSKDVALSFKSEIVEFFKNALGLDVDDEQREIQACDGSKGIQFLGVSVRRSMREGPAIRAVHKLKEKVKLVALQKQDAWDAGTVRIGKKWLGHGLKKVKESEIEHLADSNSTLSKISCFRKAGMETDHWYKVLIKVWMQDVKAKAAENEDSILSKYVVEPALPKELKESYYEFLNRANEYVSSETAATLALLPNSSSNTGFVAVTEIIAPADAIKKRLLRYGLTTSAGYPHVASLLILQDNFQIIDWFSGIVCRWLRWYHECDNFNEIKLLISSIVRKSCIRTLAAKYRINESEIEKRFDSELCRIPSVEEVEPEMTYETSDPNTFENDEALMYGISSSGLCLLSLERMVSQSRPCNCFVMGCSVAAPSVYTLHAMERQKFPGWKTGFSSCIHPSLNKRRIVLCKKHLKDLYLGHISLQSVDFGAWRYDLLSLPSHSLNMILQHYEDLQFGFLDLPYANQALMVAECSESCSAVPKVVNHDQCLRMIDAHVFRVIDRYKYKELRVKRIHFHFSFLLDLEFHQIRAGNLGGMKNKSICSTLVLWGILWRFFILFTLFFFLLHIFKFMYTKFH